MKELTVYYKFLKSSSLILIPFLLIGLILGIWYYSQQTVVYTTEQLYEVVNEDLTGDEKITVAEEIVGLLRERSVVNSDVQHLYISRVAPFAVKVVSRSDNPHTNSENLSFISRFLTDRGSFITMGGELHFVQKPSLLFFILAGLAVGGALGVCIALVKKFIQEY